jgi:hypothetical protein
MTTHAGNLILYVFIPLLATYLLTAVAMLAGWAYRRLRSAGKQPRNLHPPIGRVAASHREAPASDRLPAEG